MTSTLILILLILAAFLLGWLISRLISKEGTPDNSGITQIITEREAELAACRKQHDTLTTKVAHARSLAAEAPKVAEPTVIAPISAANEVVETTQTTNMVEATEATPIANAFMAPDRVDDLKVVEGIGPKIEELFNNAGIKTFAQLADSSVARLNEILEAAGPRYQMHNPSTWPQQAGLANSNKWTELKILQDELNKGKVE
jgi:predicted flap endonuclease-1-like 5' DNA nuclease